MMRHRLSLAALLAAAAACNSGSGSATSSEGGEGTLKQKPDQPGSFYLVDAHQGGSATRLRLERMYWGRLVDVHDVDSAGQVDPDPVFEDFVIDELLEGDGVDYLLETNPFTAQERLVILRELGVPDAGRGTFADLLERATDGVAPVFEKSDDPATPGPFSFIARNGALVLEFDDLLKDDAAAALELPLLVRARTGYPATTPHEARLLFDANHGGTAGGKFHSTRILVDFTVSAVEAARMPTPLPENLLGLPPSLPGSTTANVSLRLPTRLDPASGQFSLLRSLGGSPLAATSNGPMDFTSPTLDVVRAMRSGNGEDLSRGFLVDRVAPQLVSSWPLEVSSARPDPTGQAGVDYVVDTRFTSSCQRAPLAGDVLQIAGFLLAVTKDGGAPLPGSGVVRDLRVRTLVGGPVGATGQLLGLGTYQTPYTGAGGPRPACWVRFEPPARVFPTHDVPPDARVALTFSEPMDPAALRPYDTLQVYRGTAAASPTAIDTVVGTVASSRDLRVHFFAPARPLEHQAGQREVYTLDLAGAVDLGGNPLPLQLPRVEFELDPLVPTERAAGIVLRFASDDEYHLNDPPGGSPEFRGQLTFDPARELVSGRPVLRESWPVDQSVPVPSLMFPLPVGTDAPLSPLGSKLQTLWRHADVGWLVDDEDKHNLDVEGLSWAPFGGQTVAEFYESFEIRLGHSTRLPDEYVDPSGVLLWASSGLLDAPRPFLDNALPEPTGTLRVVHPRGLGYRVDPNASFQASSGTTMMPFPLNRGGGPPTTFTWRDTGVLGLGGADVGGIPLEVEKEVGLYPGQNAGSIYPGGSVPSVGLPLLMEFACYPSSQGIGTNSFSVGIGRLGQLFPTFRVHSTGGRNTLGRRVEKSPNQELVPSGGFNPSSTPAGQPTRSADPALYFGQLDTVVRISRAHSVWFDAQNTNPDWLGFAVEPSPADQPGRTRVEFEFRGATGFPGGSNAPFDASRLDAYGDVTGGSVTFHKGVAAWTRDLDELDGARFVQVRVTFVNDLTTGLSPTLDSFALSFERR